jgi:hypothetical protein
MEPIWPGWIDPEILKRINEKLQKDSKQREIDWLRRPLQAATFLHVKLSNILWSPFVVQWFV